MSPTGPFQPYQQQKYQPSHRKDDDPIVDLEQPWQGQVSESASLQDVLIESGIDCGK